MQPNVTFYNERIVEKDSTKATSSKSALSKLCDSLDSHRDWSLAVCQYNKSISKIFPNSHGFACPNCHTLGFVESSFCIQCHRIIQGNNKVRLEPSQLKKTVTNGLSNSNILGSYTRGKRKASCLSAEIHDVNFLTKRQRLDISELQDVAKYYPMEVDHVELKPLLAKTSSIIQLSLDAIRVGAAGFFDARQRLAELNSNMISFRTKVNGIWQGGELLLKYATGLLLCEKPSFLFIILDNNYASNFCRGLGLPITSMDSNSASAATRGCIFLLNRCFTAEDKAVLDNICRLSPVETNEKSSRSMWNIWLREDAGINILRAADVQLDARARWNINHLTQEGLRPFQLPPVFTPPSATAVVTTTARPPSVGAAQYIQQVSPSVIRLATAPTSTSSPRRPLVKRVVSRVPVSQRNNTPLSQQQHVVTSIRNPMGKSSPQLSITPGCSPRIAMMTPRQTTVVCSSMVPRSSPKISYRSPIMSSNVNTTLSGMCNFLTPPMTNTITQLSSSAIQKNAFQQLIAGNVIRLVNAGSDTTEKEAEVPVTPSNILQDNGQYIQQLQHVPEISSRQITSTPTYQHYQNTGTPAVSTDLSENQSDHINTSGCQSANDSDDLIIVSEEKVTPQLLTTSMAGSQQHVAPIATEQLNMTVTPLNQLVTHLQNSQQQQQPRIQVVSGAVASHFLRRVMVATSSPIQMTTVSTSGVQSTESVDQMATNGGLSTAQIVPVTAALLTQMSEKGTALIPQQTQLFTQAGTTVSCIAGGQFYTCQPAVGQQPTVGVRMEEPQQPPRLTGTPIQKFTYNPGGINGITLTSDDVFCLNPTVYLNDVIIDFYFKYLFHEVMTEEQRNRTHIFNCFFYNRLIQPQTNRNSSESEMLSRHASVAKWTRRVDIFDKDFIIIPINENAHWFLAVVCFPWMSGVVNYANLLQPNSSIRSETTFESDTSMSSALDNLRTSYSEEVSEVNADFAKRRYDYVKSLNEKSIEPFPCILLFDSLIGTSRAPNVKVLREYLQVEWNTKRAERDGHLTFTKDTIRGFSPKVPQQPNFSDCGVYVLHYGEMFFTNPIQSFTKNYFQHDMLKWFDTATVKEKRGYIQDLIIEKYHQSSRESTSEASTTTQGGTGGGSDTNEDDSCRNPSDLILHPEEESHIAMTSIPPQTVLS